MNSKLPIGIQDFAKLRTEGYKYIDKSEIIYRLAKSGCYYFLSRPRRFGKSLFLSTLEAYFLGRKDLFSGLEIGIAWEKVGLNILCCSRPEHTEI